MTEIYDRMVFGMHHLNITQAGAAITGSSYSHVSYELDLAGEDSGIDFWRNMMPNTYWKIVGKWGTSGTVFFWSSDKSGNPKKVMCADGNLRYITLAMTHSYENYTIGKIIGYKDVMYQEGTNGFATGNHIHLECCEGLVKEKVLSGNVYILKNMLDPRKVFFILDGYTTVKSTLGLEFKHCSEVSIKIENSGSSTGSTDQMYFTDENGGKHYMYFWTRDSSCNIRKSTTDSTIIGVMPKGKKAPIIGVCEDYWKRDNFQHCKIKYGNVTGWVQMDFSKGAYHMTDEA